MSDFFVMLVLKTVIYYSKLLGFQNFACLKLEHYSSDTDFMDRHYIVLYVQRFHIESGLLITHNIIIFKCVREIASLSSFLLVIRFIELPFNIFL